MPEPSGEQHMDAANALISLACSAVFARLPRVAIGPRGIPSGEFACDNFGSDGSDCTESLRYAVPIFDTYFVRDIWSPSHRKVAAVDEFVGSVGSVGSLGCMWPLPHDSSDTPQQNHKTLIRIVPSPSIANDVPAKASVEETAEAESHLQQTHFRDGSRRSEVRVTRHGYEGDFRRWDAHGTLICLAQYHQGRLHGYMRLFYETTGTLRDEKQYKCGRPHGRHSVCAPNGDIRKRVQYVDGVKDGLAQKWDAQKTLIYRKMYRAGRVVPTQRSAQAKGRPARENGK